MAIKKKNALYRETMFDTELKKKQFASVADSDSSGSKLNLPDPDRINNSRYGFASGSDPSLIL